MDIKSLLRKDRRIRSATTEIGNKTEQLACSFLESKGLALVEKNFRTRLGEIDLIMEDRQTLVFVEVRYRKHSHFGNPLETITESKCSRLTAAASAWLQSSKVHRDSATRFDAVTLSPDVDEKHGYQIHWFKNIIQ